MVSVADNLQVAVPFAHPARLRARALAHGFGGATLDAFRYLELRCGPGANLLPLARQFPEARFVGVEPDGQLLAQARARAEEAELPNVALFDSDKAALADADRFDYVLAHGIYSWVEQAEQRALLETCEAALAAEGVACVSYNTLPGWSVRGVVRDLMMRAARGKSGEARLVAARSLATKLHRHTEGDHPYLALFGAELALVHDKPDAELLDDHLADHNEALYFDQFVERADAAGLSYVGEMLPATPDGAMDMQLVPELMQQGLSRREAEQCLDALSYRQLRASLLCRQGPQLTPLPELATLAHSGYYAGRLAATDEPLLGPDKMLRFQAHTGVVIEADQPLLKASLLVLAAAWPQGLTAQAIVSSAMALLRERELPDAASQADMDSTVADLAQLCRRQQLELLPWTPEVRRDAPAKPRLAPLTRLEAQRTSIVTSARHEPVELDAVTRVVAQRLDGSCDPATLVRELSDRIDAGALTVEPELPLAERGEALGKLVVEALTKLRGLGLLAGDGG